MRINSVKLVNGGLKGIEVKYALPVDKDGRQFTDELTHKKKAPIHSQLEETFGWLKGHLLDICGYHLETREMDIEETEMVSVTYNEKGFILVGKKRILNSDKEIDLNTKLIEDGNEYFDFGKVTAILEGIYAETKDYMSGEKSFDDSQLVLKFNSKDKDFDIDTFTSLSKDEQRKIADSILEGMKAIAFFPEEEEDEEEDIEKYHGEVTEPVQEEEDFDLEVAPEPVVEKIKKTPAVKMTVVDDDEFEIVMTKEPVKASTAKRRAS